LQLKDTGGKWEKSLIRKSLIILFGHLWVVEETINIYIKFMPSSSLSGVCSLILFQLFAAGVNKTRGTGGKICRRCHWYRRQFATGVVDTGGAPWLAISPVIFEKIRNDPNVIIRGLGEADSWKKPEAKNLVTLSLWVNAGIPASAFFSLLENYSTVVNQTSKNCSIWTGTERGCL
jgi:hypothetical protein